MTPQSPSKKAPWDITQFSQSPAAASSYFPVSHWQSEISSSFCKVILVWEKPEVTGHQIWAIGSLSHLGDLMFCKNPAWDVICDWAHYCYKAANHQLPIAVAFCVWIVFMEEYSSVIQSCCSTCSVILNAMATHYTCSLKGIYCPHWLVQWSHCSRMYIPVHSPWLPGTCMSSKLFSLC